MILAKRTDEHTISDIKLLAELANRHSEHYLAFFPEPVFEPKTKKRIKVKEIDSLIAEYHPILLRSCSDYGLEFEESGVYIYRHDYLLRLKFENESSFVLEVKRHFEE